MIDECDYLLDLHSQASDGKPFVFLDYDDDMSTHLAKAVGVFTIIKGWPQLFETNPALNQGDTLTYANSKGKSGILLECGQHNNPISPSVAFFAIINALGTLGMVDYTPASFTPDIIQAYKLVVKPDETFLLCQEWQHLQNVSEGQVLAVSEQAEMIIAEKDSVIILPKYKARAGEEWFYLGVRELD